jgi:hypothetical protein
MALPPGFDQLATFYGRTANGGFTTVLQANVACRLTHIAQRRPGATGPERRELAGIRGLMWDPAYTPTTEVLRVQVDGVTGPDGATVAEWNVNAGTVATMRGPDGQPIFKRCDLTMVR